MTRQIFLVGLLCGLVVGVGATLAALGLVQRPKTAVAIPPQVPVHVLVEPDRSNADGIPPGAHRYEFNGQPVYIIPLAMNGN